MYESPTARAVHGATRVVWGRLEYIKVGVLVGLATAALSRPSVSGAYLKKYTRKSTTRGISYTVSSRTYTEHQMFFAFHKLLKRYMNAQQLVQCMVPPALFGGVWNTSKSVYSSGSQLLLSRPTALAART